jgi:hypothetical protein
MSLEDKVTSEKIVILCFSFELRKLLLSEYEDHTFALLYEMQLPDGAKR